MSPFLKNLKPVKQFNQLSLASIGKKPMQILEEIEEEKKVHLTIINQEASISPRNRINTNIRMNSNASRRVSNNSTPKKIKNTS